MSSSSASDSVSREHGQRVATSSGWNDAEKFGHLGQRLFASPVKSLKPPPFDFHKTKAASTDKDQPGDETMSQVSMASDPLRDAVQHQTEVTDMEDFVVHVESRDHAESDVEHSKAESSSGLDNSADWTLETPQRVHVRPGGSGDGGFSTQDRLEQSRPTGRRRQESPGDEQPPASPRPHSSQQPCPMTPRLLDSGSVRVLDSGSVRENSDVDMPADLAAFFNIDISRISADVASSTALDEHNSLVLDSEEQQANGHSPSTTRREDNIGPTTSNAKKSAVLHKANVESGARLTKPQADETKKTMEETTRAGTPLPTHRYNSSPALMLAAATTPPRYSLRSPQKPFVSSSSPKSATSTLSSETGTEGSPLRRRRAFIAMRYAAMKQRQHPSNDDAGQPPSFTPPRPKERSTEKPHYNRKVVASLIRKSKNASKAATEVASRYSIMKRQQRFVHQEKKDDNMADKAEQTAESSETKASMTDRMETNSSTSPPLEGKGVPSEQSVTMTTHSATPSTRDGGTEEKLFASPPQRRSSPPPSSYEERRRFRSVVPVRVFLESPDEFTPEFDSFATPPKEQEESYAEMFHRATNQTSADVKVPLL